MYEMYVSKPNTIKKQKTKTEQKCQNTALHKDIRKKNLCNLECVSWSLVVDRW